MTRSTIGLDLSYTSTGIAVFIDGAFSEEWSTIVTTKPDKTRAYDSLWRAGLIAKEIQNLVNRVAATTRSTPSVWIEGYAYGAFANRERLGELGGIVKDKLLRNGVEYEVLPVTVVRKFVCGKGNARKDVVMQSLLKRYAIDLTQNDLADAAALGITGDHIVLDRAKQVDLDKLYADAGQVLKVMRSKDTKLEAV